MCVNSAHCVYISCFDTFYTTRSRIKGLDCFVVVLKRLYRCFFVFCTLGCAINDHSVW